MTAMVWQIAGRTDPVRWDNGDLTGPLDLVEQVGAWAAVHRGERAAPIVGTSIPVGFDTDLSAWATITAALDEAPGVRVEVGASPPARLAAPAGSGPVVY